MLPLAGITVLDASYLLPGPYATMLLADLGANVIKVELPGTGDPFRHMGRGLFETANRNKRSVAINLKHPEGRELFLRLAGKANAVVEEFRPGVAGRLGIGYEQVRAVNPAIVYCSISTYGQTGPLRDVVGHDLNCMALSGALGMARDQAGKPVRPGLPIADLTASMFAALSIAASVRAAERTGEGRYLDISMTDVLLSWLSVRLPEWALDEGLPDPSAYGLIAATNTIFRTADDRYIAVGAVEEKLWRNLCQAVDRPAWMEDPCYRGNASRLEHRGELLAELEAIFRTRTLAEWVARCESTGVPYAPVNTVAEALRTPQFLERGLFRRVEAGDRTLNQVRFPVDLDPDVGIDRPPPAVGEQTDEILSGLGLGPSEIENLRQAGAIG